MNQLTIEHLSPYLPHQLVVWHRRHSYPKSTSLRELTPTVLCYVEAGGINTIKPILRPLSDLTKEINHRGETFVPIKRLNDLFSNTPNYDMHLGIWLVKYPDLTETNIEYCVMQQLHSWLFDTQSLIESGLAISVHDLEFNPYET